MEGVELRLAIREAQGLVGARLAKVHQVGDLLLLRLFSPPGALALDAGGKAFHRTQVRPPTPPAPPPFCRRVRALEGQKLLSIDQAGYDRVVRLRFQGGSLVLDLRPRLGNLFLLEGRRVLASLRRSAYVPGEFGGEADVLAGMGPRLRKAAAAALGHAPSEEDLRAFAQGVLAATPRGYLYQRPGGLLASPVPLPELGEPSEIYPGYWQALDRALEARLSLDIARRYLAAVRRAINRRQRALAALARELDEAARWEELQGRADLILARLSQIPRGQARVEVEGFDGKPVLLNLDPALPPAQEAQRLYSRARKLRRKLELLPARRRVLEGELAQLGKLEAELSQRPYLAPYLAEELAALGALPAERQPKRTPRPRPRELVVQGFRIQVGRSARENDELVRRARPHDLWLHARGVPGAHVLVSTGGKEVPEEVLVRAAELAAWHSRARGEPKVEVSYTEVRHLRKPKGAPPGLVMVKKERVIVVSGEAGA